MTARGFLAGTQVQPRTLAKLAYETGSRWQDAQTLVEAVSICLAESQGYDRARNDNVGTGDEVTSRDVGIFQINIPARYIGTPVEEDLYDVKANAKAAYDLYVDRGWQPWVAFNTGIYLDDSYLRRAALGVMNFLAETLVIEAKGRTKRVVPVLTPVPMLSAPEFKYVREQLWPKRPAAK